jgi:hypothetical protein
MLRLHTENKSAVPPKPDKPAKPDATRRDDGKFQTNSNWLRNGGKNPTIRL